MKKIILLLTEDELTMILDASPIGNYERALLHGAWRTGQNEVDLQLTPTTKHNEEKRSCL